MPKYDKDNPALIVYCHEGVICDTIEFDLRGEKRSLPNCKASWQAIHDAAEVMPAVQRFVKYDGTHEDTDWFQCPAYLHRRYWLKHLTPTLKPVHG